MKHIFQRSSKSTTVFRRCNTNFPSKTAKDSSLFSVTTASGTLRLFSLAFPLLLEFFMLQMLGTVNTLVLSGFSEDAVAAVGSVTPLFNLFMMFFSAIATGATVIIGHLIGAEELHQGSKTTFTALVACMGFSVLFSAILLAASQPIISLLQLKGIVSQYAHRYFYIRIFALPLSATTSILLAVLRCFGHAKATVLCGFSSNACNLLCSLYVVYGTPPTFLSGVTGIAVACVLGQLLSLVLSLIFFLCKGIAVCRPGLLEFAKLLYKIFKIGLPSGLSACSITVSQIVTTPFIATLGETALAAKVYFSNILCYTYAFSYSVGTANSLLISRLCGADKYEHANKLNRRLIRITAPVNLSVSLTLLLCRLPLLALFTDSDTILKMSLGIFLVDILAEQARSVSQIYEYALRAAGDVTFTMILVITSCWVCGVGLTYILIMHSNVGLIGYWIAVALDEIIRALVTVYRWRTGKWQHHWLKERRV